jgi:hypothetical protein
MQLIYWHSPVWHAPCEVFGVTDEGTISMNQTMFALPLIHLSLLDRAIFASISAMSVFALFSPLISVA